MKFKNKFTCATLIMSLFLSVCYPAQTYAETTRNYDCSTTGRCSDQTEQKPALELDNIAPGQRNQQIWNLENTSNFECRVYLRIQLRDDPQQLSEKIMISAVGAEASTTTRNNGLEVKNTLRKPIVQQTTFAKLLKRQSIYMGKLPANSIGTIEWNITLDPEVANQYQAAQERFTTLLYSYCLDRQSNQQNQILGATTENQIISTDLEPFIYGILSLLTLMFALKLYRKLKEEK